MTRSHDAQDDNPLHDPRRADLAATANPAHAEAVTEHLSFHGRYAEAVFSSTDATGCVVTDLYLAADDGRIRAGQGGPAPESAAFMCLSRYDLCTDTQLDNAAGFAALAADQFQTDRKLTAAHLDATLDLIDEYTRTSTPVTVNVTWTGAGDTIPVRDHLQIKEPSFKINSHLSGTLRHATAAGTVTHGATNLTPKLAVDAQIGSIKTGDVLITRE